MDKYVRKIGYIANDEQFQTNLPVDEATFLFC